MIEDHADLAHYLIIIRQEFHLEISYLDLYYKDSRTTPCSIHFMHGYWYRLRMKETYLDQGKLWPFLIREIQGSSTSTTTIMATILRNANGLRMKSRYLSCANDSNNTLMDGQTRMMIEPSHSNLKGTRRIGLWLEWSTQSWGSSLVAQHQVLVEMKKLKSRKGKRWKSNNSLQCWPPRGTVISGVISNHNKWKSFLFKNSFEYAKP